MLREDATVEDRKLKIHREYFDCLIVPYADHMTKGQLDILYALEDMGLAVWYMDDGSLNKRYHTIVLCTNSFSTTGQLLAIDYFKEKYHIDAVLEPRRNQQTVIRINASQSRKFMDLVAPHIPPCMSYKLW